VHSLPALIFDCFADNGMELLFKGGQGTVFRGTLKGTPVAVKRLPLASKRAAQCETAAVSTLCPSYAGCFVAAPAPQQAASVQSTRVTLAATTLYTHNLFCIAG